MKIYSLKRNAIPKIAVLATGLTAAVLVATINPTPAQAFPNKQAECTTCHGPGTVGGTTTATPSTLTPAAGAAYTVAITISANASAGDTGYWIANSDAAGATGATTGVYGGYVGTSALSYAANMTAPTAAGTYYYKVWTVNGSTGSAATTTNFKVYSITVAPVVTIPPTTIPPTTIPPTTIPPVTSAASISSLSPRHGAIGDTVTITGTGFGTVGSVQFGAIVLTASSWTDTQIDFIVPAGTLAKVAPVSVIPGSDTASNAVNFRFDHVKAAGAHHSLGENHSFMDGSSHHGVHSGWFGPRHHLLFGGDDD